MMAKIKERKSESWKPGLLHDDGYISKNKKRKDKRMSLNLSAKKIDTDEFIPIKKSALALTKTKDSWKSTPNKFLSPALDKKHTPKKKDTPLPAFESKTHAKSVSTPNARKLSLAEVSSKLNGTPKLNSITGVSPKKNKEVLGSQKVKLEAAGTLKVNQVIGANKVKLEPAGTPKVNLEPTIKSSLKKKAQKFIDYEAEEGEEPITDKGVKPYVKGQKGKSISFKLNDKEIDSDSDESDDSNDDETTGPRSYLDDEASEGEETDDSDSGVSDDDDDDDDDDGEDSDTFGSFLAGDSEDEDEASDEEDSNVSGEDGDSDEEDSDESDEKKPSPKNQPKKMVPLPPFSPVKNSHLKNDSDDSEDDENDEKQQPKFKKSDAKTTAKSTPALIVPLNQSKKEKVKKLEKAVEPSSKKTKLEENVAQKTKKEKKSEEGNEKPPVTTDYAGFIKYLPNTIKSDEIKAALTSAVSAENIVSIVLKKNNKKKSNRCFVYVSDEDSIDKLENVTFTIGKNVFKVFKARESKKLVKTQPLAFLPRVPLSIDDEKLKSIIESDIGPSKIISLKSKKENEKLQTRNVLIELSDDEVLKKIVYKGSYAYKGIDVIVRQAFESGFTIPVYKIVFSGIPENTTEAILKKAIELKIGKGTVMSVKFSFRKNSFAFVTLNDEQSQKKLLEPGIEISINKTKLIIEEFKPRVPNKRGPTKKKDKQTPPAKKQKIDQSSPGPKPKKAKKKKTPSQKLESSTSSTKTEPNQSQKKSKPVQNPAKQKNQSLNQSQNNVQNLSPKTPKLQGQKNSPPKNKKAKSQIPDKKANLNNKLEAKKNKMKDKKNKKKKADASD